MSDNEDLLGEDLGDQSLADYNLGNDEEEQLLADDYENAAAHNVPPSGHGYVQVQSIEYGSQQGYIPGGEESVVPNLPLDATPVTYAPYEPPQFIHPREQLAVVPPPMMAASIESSQIVPSEMNPPITNGAALGPRCQRRTPRVRDIPDTLDKVLVPRSHFAARGSRTTWRNPHYNHPYKRLNVQRGNVLQQRPAFPPPQGRPNQPQIRSDLPQMGLEPPQIPLEPPQDLLDPAISGNPPPQMVINPTMRPLEPQVINEQHLGPNPPQIALEQPLPPGLNIIPDGPGMVQEHLPPQMPFAPINRPNFEPTGFPPRFPPNHPNFRPNLDDRPNFGPRPNFERPPFRFQQRPGQFVHRQFAPHMDQMPQGPLRHPVPHFSQNNPKMGMGPGYHPSESEGRMMPVQLSNVPPGLSGKKVLINPHFKGNFAPVEGIATYIPTRIQKSPPNNSPSVENKFGPVKDLDDAAERFIAEQRNALARAANRKFQKRSPQRYIENTTIEIENDLARVERARRKSDDELLRRQEEFINANRAGLRRRMRSPSPPDRRSLSPRLSPDQRRLRPERSPPRHDEESDYRRRVREQESLRERVLRAKEVRRRKNAVALTKQLYDRDTDRTETARPVPDTNKPGPETNKPGPETNKPVPGTKSPERATTERVDERKTKEVERVRNVKTPEKERSPHKDIVRSEEAPNMTPPREKLPEKVKEKTPEKVPIPAPKLKKVASPERDLTPPLPIPVAAPKKSDTKVEEKAVDYDFDDLDLILDDFEGILSDDDDTGRFKEQPPKKLEPPQPPPKPSVDLRSKLPPRVSSIEQKKIPSRQKIIFHDVKEVPKRRDKTPPKKPVVTSSTNIFEDTPSETSSEQSKTTPNVFDTEVNLKRQKIIFNTTGLQAKDEDKQKALQFSNRRVVLQRKVTNKPEKSIFNRMEKNDPTKPNPGIFSRAIRNTIANDTKPKVAVMKQEEPQVLFEDSDLDEDYLLQDDASDLTVAMVANLPYGMTDTRLKTLAGPEVQNINLDKEVRSAKIIFKSSDAAESFKKKFHNKMVAASRLSVVLQ